MQIMCNLAINVSDPETVSQMKFVHNHEILGQIFGWSD